MIPSALSLIPPVAVLIIAIWVRRPIFALIVGSIVGLLLINPMHAMDELSSVSLKVMKDDTIGWLILVCGCFGALISLLVSAGGALAFGKLVLKYAKTRRSSLFMTFFLGVVIFIDDYLNALTVGETMQRVTDKFKISREMLAYIVDSTAAPICVIIPISTWAVFFGGLLVDNKIAPKGHGIDFYIQAIPYMFYAWLSLIVLVLVIVGIMPIFGAMKKAEIRAATGNIGEVNEDEFDEIITSDDYTVRAMEDEFYQADQHGKLYNFLIPLLLLVGFTVYFDIDIWKGLLATLAITIPLYLSQKLMTLPEMMDHMIEGFKTMLPAIGTVVSAFVFKDICDKLMLSQYVINSLTPYMTPKFLPAVVFITMSILAFVTGSSWGIFAVTIPIIMPLAHSVGASDPIVIGALLSAASFGSQACFYSDSTVLAAQGSGCDLMGHALTQLPYTLISAGLALIGFVIIA